uniref:BTB/POZ domain-containing protein KCTD7 n=1 Tax=Phallusia mammillata TaxID=59560 RepID=A0A6F9DG49_9ASCI|nr:BTB/POZ domain-containing protein KCTD7-like [Phallusia mammillata]
MITSSDGKRSRLGMESLPHVVQVLDVNENCTKMTTCSNSSGQSLPEVVELNVGGVHHTTSLSTLRKFPESMLAAMFSGRHHINTDKNGRFFIDRDGSLFHHVLNFLRQGDLPGLDCCLKVYHEAQFYNIQPMIDAMDLLRPIAGEKQKKNFLQHVPNYDSNLHLLLTLAQQIANLHPDRISRLKVCVYKTEMPSTVPPLVPGEFNPCLYHQKHMCDASVTFGPWTATPDVYDLIDCIKHDLAEKGYELEHRCIGVCDKHIVGQHYCKRSIFEFKFKWW